ncbi:MAG: hypothetical protein ACLFWL_18900 [Candidatus Brocadiia bacterium]
MKKKTIFLVTLLILSLVANVVLGVMYHSLRHYYHEHFRFVGKLKGACAGNPWPSTDEKDDWLSQQHASKEKGYRKYVDRWREINYRKDGSIEVKAIKLGRHLELWLMGDKSGHLLGTGLLGEDGYFEYRWNPDGTLKTPSEEYRRRPQRPPAMPQEEKRPENERPPGFEKEKRG